MRFFKKIEPLETKEFYIPDSIISLTLPNEIVDLHSFILYYTGIASHYYRTTTNVITKRFFPRLSASVINELIIEIDGQTKQYTREYGYLYNCLNDIRNEYDDIQGTAFDTIQQHKIDINGDIINTCKYRASIDTQETTDDFFINKWLGFLNEGNQYFDARNKNVKITIKLASSSILYNGVNTSGAFTIAEEYPRNYKLTNVYATIYTVDDEPSINKEFFYENYMTVKGLICKDSKSTTMSCVIEQPVVWSMGVFMPINQHIESELVLQHANTDITKYGGLMKDTVTIGNYNAKIPVDLLYSYDVSRFQKDPYLLNNSLYFNRDGLNVKNTKWRVNSYDITPYMNMSSILNETKRVFNSEYKRVISLQSFEANFFVNAVEIDDMTFSYKNIEWEVLNDPFKFNSGGNPYLYTCVLSKL